MSYQKSLADLLIATLCSGRNVRAFRSIIREREFGRYKRESVKVALSRLQTRRYLRKSKLGWSVTRQGKNYTRNNRSLGYINSPFTNKGLANTILSFDIPEKNRSLRNWLRIQIKIFGYKMLQQSLWIGPGPLPSSFMKRLEDLGIRKNVKTFKITRRNS